MKKITTLFLLVVFHVAVIREVTMQCQPINQNLLKAFSDKLGVELIIWTGMKGYELHCIQQCVDDFRCITVQYSESRKHCRTYAADSKLVEKSAVPVDYAITTYQVTGRVGYGVACQETQQCTVPNSECQSDGCLCQTSHSFNSTTASCDLVRYLNPCNDVSECNFRNSKCADNCVCQDYYLWDPIIFSCAAGCTKYGSSYIQLEGSTFIGFSLRSYYSSTWTFTSDYCINKCNQYPECKSFILDSSENRCYLKSHTWFEVPDSHRQHSPNTFLGQRRCVN